MVKGSWRKDGLERERGGKEGGREEKEEGGCDGGRRGEVGD